MAGNRKLLAFLATLLAIYACGELLPESVSPSAFAAIVTALGLFVGGNAGEHLAARIGNPKGKPDAP
jgi:hypothetical protein